MIEERIFSGPWSHGLSILVHLNSSILNFLNMEGLFHCNNLLSSLQPLTACARKLGRERLCLRSARVLNARCILTDLLTGLKWPTDQASPEIKEDHGIFWPGNLPVHDVIV